MKYGFILPFGEARLAADLAFEAEQAGWDGFFVWESVWGTDAWVSLAAAAMRTQRIRLGTMLTPLSRMRPWKLASESMTLDRLSGGRVIIAVGLGALDTGFAAFGEVTDRKMRAELLDEGLDIVTRLWQGRPFSYTGKHYQVDINSETFRMPLPPSALQQPRIPIWVVAAWPRQKSMRRALRYDGLLPNVMDKNDSVRMGAATPHEVRAIAAYVKANRQESAPFDIIIEGETPGDDREKASSIVRPYEQAGATWWLEARWTASQVEPVVERVKQGPPR